MDTTHEATYEPTAQAVNSSHGTGVDHPTTPQGSKVGVGPSYGGSYASAPAQEGGDTLAMPRARAHTAQPDLRRQGAPQELCSGSVEPPLRAAEQAAARRTPRRRARNHVQRRGVTVRLSEEEKAEVALAARAAGVARARFMAQAILDATRGTTTLRGRGERDQRIDELAAARTQVAKVGTNLNQIAHRLNAGGPVRPVDQSVLAEVRLALAEVKRLVTCIDAAAHDQVARRGR